MPPRSPTPFYELGQAIKNARIAKDLRQREVAEKTGMSLRQLALVEAGENVSLSFVEKLVDYLGIRELPLGRALVRIRRGDVDRLNAMARDARILAGNVASILLAVKFVEDADAGLAAEIGGGASGEWADDLIDRFEQLRPDAKQFFLDQLLGRVRLDAQGDLDARHVQKPQRPTAARSTKKKVAGG